MLIDTHCHLTFKDLAGQTRDVLKRAAQAGVTRVLTVSETVADARRGLELVGEFPQICLIAGIHPHHAAKCQKDDLLALGALLDESEPGGVPRNRIVAVGETGLDFHYDFAPPAEQEQIFRAHLEIAAERDMPVVLHARKAERRVADILREYPPLLGRFVFHCYSADVETARYILDLGGWLSFTGVVTFQKAEPIRASARYAPLERLLIETDAPYLSPEPVRKIFPNEPAFVAHTARFLANLRGEPFDRFAAATTANAITFFRLPEVHG
jgi:TatD DNase family protein